MYYNYQLEQYFHQNNYYSNITLNLHLPILKSEGILQMMTLLRKRKHLPIYRRAIHVVKKNPKR